MSLNYIAFRSNEKFCYYSHFSLKHLTFLIVTSFFLFLVFRSPNSTAFPLILLASLPSLTFGLTLSYSLNIWRADQGPLFFFFFLYYTLWSLSTHMLFSFRNYSHDTDDFQISIFSPCFSHDLYFQWTDYSIALSTVSKKYRIQYTQNWGHHLPSHRELVILWSLFFPVMVLLCKQLSKSRKKFIFLDCSLSFTVPA